MHLRSRNNPDHFETERLLVRAPQAGQGSVVYEAIVESLDALREWPASLPWAIPEPTLEAAEAYCSAGQRNFLAGTDLPMLIFSRADGGFIGCTGLHRLDISGLRLEVGYWCRTSRAGQGFIREAVRGLVAYAQQTLAGAHLEILTDAANPRSRAVAQATGFILDGTLHRERRAPDGSFRDTCRYIFPAQSPQRRR